MFNIHVTANLPRNLPVNFFTSVKMWQNYGHESVIPFFGPPCRVAHFVTCGAEEITLAQSSIKMSAIFLQQHNEDKCRIVFYSVYHWNANCQILVPCQHIMPGQLAGQNQVVGHSFFLPRVFLTNTGFWLARRALARLTAACTQIA